MSAALREAAAHSVLPSVVDALRNEPSEPVLLELFARHLDVRDAGTL